MLRIEGQTFGEERLPIDGKQFENCVFNGTTLVFSGGQCPTFNGGAFHGVALDFEDAGYETIKLLRQFALIGGEDFILAQFRLARRAKN